MHGQTVKRQVWRIASVVLSVTLTLLIPCLISCGGEAPTVISGFAFDTLYQFTLYGDAPDAPDVLRARLAGDEDILSATREGALVSRLNGSADTTWNVTDQTLAAILNRAFALTAQTGGYFDPALGALREIWAIDDQTAPIPTDDEISDALRNAGISHMTYDAASGQLIRDTVRVRLDLGAIAKGWTLDRLIADARAAGCRGGVLDFGGTVAVFGEKPDGEPFRIGIRNPYEPESGEIGYVTLPAGTTAVVSVAGLYERYKTVDDITYTHIFDPATGYPSASDLLSVAVISADGTAADALCTALLVMGSEGANTYLEAHQGDGIAAVLYRRDGQVTTSGNISYEDSRP